MGTIVTLHKPNFSEHATYEPTILATWYEFVRLGERRSAVTIDVDVESYLVFTLIRFMHDVESFSTVLAMELLKASTEYTGHKKEAALNNVGDVSLLLAGLYPERHQALRVSKRYFIEIGRIAFASLAMNFEKRKFPAKAKLFHKVERGFPSMINILCAAREDQMLMQ